MKEEKYFRGKYYQGSLNDTEAEAIHSLIKDYGVVNNLKHCIKNTPDYLVDDIKKDYETYESENGSVEGFSKNYEKIGVGTLQDQQTIGVAFLYLAGSAMLGDEVGLGKTVQVAGLVNLLEFENKDFRFCFLTEKTSIGQIRDKLIKFTGKFVGMLESGEKDVVEKYLESNKSKRHYSIVGGHSLLTSSEFLVSCKKMPFDLIIIDESHILKNTSSDYYPNCSALFKYCKRKILLNATPFELYARDFYNQLDLLDKNYLPGVGKFIKSYCKMGRGIYGNKVIGYKDNVEEFREAVSLRYLARTRKDLGAKHTENTYKTIIVPLSSVQKELFKKTSLYQMASDYPTGVDRRIEFNEITTPKVSALLDLLSKLDVVGDKVIIYCRFIDCQEGLKILLQSKGYKCEILNGKSKTKERVQKISNFNEGVYDIIITNVQRGLDFNYCNNCILYTIDPNPQKMAQLEGRMTRELDIEYKSVYLLVSEGKEKKFVEEQLKLRAQASSAFVGSGSSMVLEALRNGENKELFVMGE